MKRARDHQKDTNACCRRVSAKIVGFTRRTALFAPTPQGVGIQPLLVLEKGAKRQGNLSVLVSFRARRESPGITQDVAPVLDKLGLAVARMVLHQYTSNRRHDLPPYLLSVTG